MKAKDIVVGQEYSIGRSMDARFPDRAVVLEVGNLERQINVRVGRGYSRRTSTAPGALIRRMHRDGSPLPPSPFVETVVPLSQVLRTWDDQMDHEDRTRSQEAAAAQRDADLRAAADGLKAALEARGISANAWVRYGHVEVTLYGVDTVAALASFLEDPLGMEASGVAVKR